MLSAQHVNSNNSNITINNNNISGAGSSLLPNGDGAFRSDEQQSQHFTDALGARRTVDGKDANDANANADVSSTSAFGAKGKAGRVEDQPVPHEMNPHSLHLLSHPLRGRGVFAPSSIRAGTILEDSPVLLLSKAEWDEGRMNDTILGEYGFCWSNGGMAIGLGLASLFNHSSTPNVNFIRNTKEGTIRFITSRAVVAGEELCICYSADETKLWFAKSDPVASASTSTTSNPQLDSAAKAAKSTPNGDSHPDQPHSDDPFPFLPNGGYSGDNSDEELSGVLYQDGLELFAPEDAAERLEKLKLREVRKAQIKAQERSSKEARRARWFAKHHRDPSLPSSSADATADPSKSPGGLAQPIPLHLEARPTSWMATGDADAGSSGSQTPSGVSGSGSDAYSYAYPEVPEGLVHEGDLPPPLHSQMSLREGKEAPLVDDLDWREGDWPGDIEVADWGAAVRVKGLTEEKEEERDQSSTLEIWVAEVADPRLTRLILNFIKDMCTQDPNLRHLKRVARKIGPDGVDRSYIALCATYEVESLHAITAMLADYNELLSDLVPTTLQVPCTPARSLAQIKTKNLLWPVVYAPLPARLDDDSQWPAARKSWVLAGIRRILADALDAKARGELPVATFVTSPPASFWPVTDAFVPPTPNLRAAAHDTRLSEKHPLRHAAFNCIAQIASLRTRPPFCTISPTRNGADYLLTSLSLFITHEPCVMCAMALLHSRVREVFYIFPRERGGGFESAFGVHGRKDLNHRYDVWKYSGPLPKGVEEELRVDLEIAL